MTQGFASEFEGTPYQDQEWPAVGKRIKNDTFEAMQVQILRTNVFKDSPLFEDYGGRAPEKIEQRFHLPDKQAFLGEDYVQREEEAEKIKKREAELLQKIDLARTEGYEEGKLKAFEEAAEKSAERIKELQTHINTILAEMQKQVRARVMKIEADALELSLAVGKKIVGAAVEINPEYIIPLLQQALGLRGGAVIKNVRVSPQDYEFIQVVGVAPSLKDFDGTWSFVADPAITSGCVVETSAGEIDFKLDAAWERVQNAVVKAVGAA